MSLWQRSIHSSWKWNPRLLIRPCISRPCSMDSSSPSEANMSESAKEICSLLSKPWDTSIESHLTKALPTLTPQTIIQVLSNVESPLQGHSFFRWTLDNGFRHTLQTYQCILEILGSSKQLVTAKSLLLDMNKHGIKCDPSMFNIVLRAYANAGIITETLWLFKKIRDLRVVPTDFTYNILFSLLLKRGRTISARKFYNIMVNEGVEPSVYTFNIMIRGMFLSHRYNDAVWFFEEMRRKNVPPSIVTYNSMIDGLCKNGKIESALRIWNGMSRMSPSVVPNVITYTSVISGLCKKGRLGEASETLDKMIKEGVEPNAITYNTIIQALCDSNQLDKAQKFFQEMVRVDFMPDSCTFNILIRAHCNAGQVYGALKIFEKMRDVDAEANSSTYSTLIKGFCDVKDFDKAFELVDDLVEKGVLLKVGSCVPVVASYNQILTYLCENGKTEKADRLFRQLLKFGTQNPASFDILILGHCKEGNTKAGFELLKVMITRNYPPNVEVFDFVIQSFLKNGCADDALEAVDTMLDCGHVPSVSAFRVVIERLLQCGSVKAAGRALKIMLLNKIRTDQDVYVEVVIGLFSRGFVENALECVRLLYDKRCQPDVDRVFRSLFQKSKYFEAQKLLFALLEKNIDFNVKHYDVVLRNLCTSGKVMEACSLFYDMAQKGKKPARDCCELLVLKLKEEGKSKEAEFVTGQIEQNDD